MYLHGQSINPIASLNCPITLHDAVACGTLRRQLSNTLLLQQLVPDPTAKNKDKLKGNKRN